MSKQLVFRKKDLGKIDVGQYRGKKWKDLPEKYLRAILGEKGAPQYLKDAARFELTQRNMSDGQICLFPEEGLYGMDLR